MSDTEKANGAVAGNGESASCDDPWVMTVNLSRGVGIDADEVRKSLEILIDPKGAHEIRGLPSARSRLVRGSDLDAAIGAIQELSNDKGVYYTLNPVRLDLGNRAAKVGDITERRWLLVDCDRRKASHPDDMATEEEKAHVMALSTRVLDWLLLENWPAPILIDSGNGAHLAYRIELPASNLTRVMIGRFLKTLAARFDNEHAYIDTKVHNASRISKLPGTWVRKGVSTADRPWRMARLLWVPDQIEIVSLQQIEAIAGTSPDEKTEGDAEIWDMVVRSGPDRVAAYVRSAIEREIARVVLANEGTRNISLNNAAFAIGQFVGAKLADRGEMVQRLTDAAMRSGLREPEIGKTIESGLGSGSDQPRVIPDYVTRAAPGRNGTATPGKKTTEPPERLTIGLDEITTCKVDWLWENRVAIGFISLFAGRTGLGKSFVTCDVIARLSRGEMLPYSGIQSTPARTLIISEDPPEQMLGPRLIELGTVRQMVRFMTFKAMVAYTLQNTEMLERAYRECDEPTLIVIDPPSNFLGGADEHKNAEVRNVLMGIVSWLNSRLSACIMITHVNKQVGKGIEAVDRIMGSAAWASTARIALAFAKDPDEEGRYLCAGIKNNLGPLADTLAYRIEKTDTLAKVSWLGKVETTADEAMNQTKKKSRGQCAVEWLTERFRERREWESDELKRMAFQNGLSKNALWSPEVNALPISKRRRHSAAGDEFWVWVAHDGWPPLEK